MRERGRERERREREREGEGEGGEGEGEGGGGRGREGERERERGREREREKEGESSVQEFILSCLQTESSLSLIMIPLLSLPLHQVNSIYLTVYLFCCYCLFTCIHVKIVYIFVTF